MIRILAFAGSTRRDSWNRRLATLAVSRVPAHGAEVTHVELADFPIPLYDADLEARAGLPEKALELRGAMLEHDALLLACPEYNGSITPLLKNTIDWTSRPSEGVPGLAAYKGKVAALLSTSPGALGGLRGLVHVRSVLTVIGVHVVPGDVSVPLAPKAFDADGGLLDEKLRRRLDGLLETLVATTAALRAGR